MEMLHNGHLIVVLSAVIQWFIGVIWYSPALFGPSWKALVANPAIEKKTGDTVGGLVFAVGNLIVSYLTLRFFVFTGVAGIKHGVIWGGFLWFGFFAVPLLVQYVSERRPIKLYVINAGYWLVALMVCGAVLGRLR
jgi:hypothetical protein